jgi:hypothetical protein
MAETLETTQLLANTFEPKRKFRWILAIDGVDAFTLKTAKRPSFTMGEVTIDYINTKRYVSGKQTWNPIPIATHDPIAPSAAQKVMDWARLNYEPLTGRMGYAAFYKKDISLKMLDPQGTVVELWDINGAWLQEVDFGELDFASDDNVEITATLRYDSATLQF